MNLTDGSQLGTAFWMLGDDISSVGWPACGELDIMEAVGFEPQTIHGTMHFGPQWPNNKYTGDTYHLPGKNFSDEYHVFGMEKFEDQIRMHVDGVVYMERTKSDILPNSWPFNDSFHFLLNVAIGGQWPGNPELLGLCHRRQHDTGLQGFHDLHFGGDLHRTALHPDQDPDRHDHSGRFELPTHG